MAKIGVAHIGWHGHVGPANRLTAVLARQGHRLVAWAPEHFRGSVQAAGAELRPFGWDARAAVPSAPSGPLAASKGRGFAPLAVEMAKLARFYTGPLIDALHAEDIELVVHDAMTPWARVAADFLGLPRICSFPGHPPAWPYNLGSVSPEQAATLEECRDDVRQRWGIELGDGAAVLISAGDATMIYSTPEVLGKPVPEPSWQLVGPLMGPAPDQSDEPALADLDGRPLVYVALGTTFNYRSDVFRAVLDALAAEEVNVLLSMGGRDPAEVEPVPGNARVVPRVVARAVLRRTAVHVTHGGASSVHESLVAGVPMVCVPQGADNARWGARVAALGVGEVIYEPTEENLRATVLRVLGDESMRLRTGELAGRLEAFDGEPIVAETVEKLLA